VGAVCVVAGVLAACGTGGGARRAEPPEAPLRIWAPPIVRWATESERRVAFVIENPTQRTIALAAPDPRHARVEVFAGPESIRLCGVEPRPSGTGAIPPVVELAPGERAAVLVDLGEPCRGLPPGDYRYELSYRAPEPGPEGAFGGVLATRHGQLFVAAARAVEQGARRGHLPDARVQRGAAP
jgi:hypothetical protein